MITSVVMLRPERSFHTGSRFLVCLFLLVMTALCAGCSTTSTTIIDEEIVTNNKPMALYTSLIVKDFELSRELYTDLPEARMGERDRRYVMIPGQLSDQIMRYVKSRHIYATVSRDEVYSPTTLVLKGKFTRIGRFRISVEAMLVDGVSNHEVAYFRETLWDVFDTTDTVGRLGQGIADFIDRIQYK